MINAIIAPEILESLPFENYLLEDEVLYEPTEAELDELVRAELN
jgi:hypothetical protein